MNLDEKTMGKVFGRIPDNVEAQFRAIANLKFLENRSPISDALTEAISAWITENSDYLDLTVGEIIEKRKK